MKNFILPRAALSFILSAFVTSLLFSQKCIVEKDSLKGTYTGECKKGKANGKGKAIGVDTYEGMFKEGLPDGQGTYIWSNGNVYTGKFEKGNRQGKGMFTYKRENKPDSVLDGFWKNDSYFGKYEKPYIIHYTSRLVTGVDINFQKDVFDRVIFWVTSTSGGAISMNGGEITKMQVDDIQMAPGHYDRITTNSDHAKKTETILYKVSYPARMKVTIGSEMIEIELLEEGSYVIDVRINQ